LPLCYPSKRCMPAILVELHLPRAAQTRRCISFVRWCIQRAQSSSNHSHECCLLRVAQARDGAFVMSKYLRALNFPPTRRYARLVINSTRLASKQQDNEEVQDCACYRVS